MARLAVAPVAAMASTFASRVPRWRGRGLAKIDAIAATGATANRAIFFSGMTVVLAMSGMVIIPLDIMIGMGVGVMLVVVTTLLTALILLPALLGLLGDRINALRVPFVGKLALKRANGSGGLWERLAHSIMRRPVVWLTVAVVALLVVAAPVVVMKKGNPTASAAHLPSSEYAKQGWDILDRDFSLGKANPLMIVIDGQVTSPDVEQAVGRLQAAMKADGRFAARAGHRQQGRRPDPRHLNAGGRSRRRVDAVPRQASA